MLKWLATVQVLWINFSVNVNTAGLSIGEKLLLNITQSKAILEMARAMKIRSTEESFSLFIQPMQFTSAMKALAKFPRINSTINRMKRTPDSVVNMSVRNGKGKENHKDAGSICLLS